MSGESDQNEKSFSTTENAKGTPSFQSNNVNHQGSEGKGEIERIKAGGSGSGNGSGGNGSGGNGGMKMTTMVGMVGLRRTNSTLVGSPLFDPPRRRLGHRSLSFSASSSSSSSASSSFFSSASSPAVIPAASAPTPNSYFFLVSPMPTATKPPGDHVVEGNSDQMVDGRIASSSSSSSSEEESSVDTPSATDQSSSSEEQVSRPQQLFPWTLQSLGLPIPFARAIYSIPPEAVDAFWVQYITSTPLMKNKVARDSRVLTRLVSLGIPMNYRTSIWAQLALDLLPADVNIQSTYAGYLREAERPEFDSVSLRAIEGDLQRTYPEHPDFQDEDSVKIQRMRKILGAYSIRNTDVGYCQGMNFIVGFFLNVGFEEVAAFEMLVIFMDYMMAPEYYTDELLGLHVDQEVIQDILKHQLPRLSTHLKKYNIPITLATMNWLLTGFLSVLPFGVCCRIWDLFFLHGVQAFFWVSLALFKLMEDQVMAMSNAGEIYTLFVQFPPTIRDSSKLVETALRFQKQVGTSLIEAKRKQYLPKIQKQCEEHRARTLSFGLEGTEGKDKDENWNIVESEAPPPAVQSPKKKTKNQDSFELVE